MNSAKERRLKKELSRLVQEEFQVESGNDSVKVLLPAHKLLQIDLGAHYPFICPEMYIDQLSYKDLLYLNPNQQKMFLRLFPQSCCLVCSSFVCKQNWNVCKTLKDIILDVCTHLDKKEAVMAHELWTRAQRKFNLPFFSIISFLIHR